MEKIHYELKVLQIVRKLPELAKSMGLNYDDTYLNFHNQICPSCQSEMKMRNGFIQNPGSVGTAMLFDVKKLYPYLICKPCTKNIEKLPESKRKDKSAEIEDYIESVVPKQ